MEKVLGMGNALVDILNQMQDDQILEKFKLPRGSMQLVNSDFANSVLEATESLPRQRTSGGSAANTIHGLSHLGIEAGFIGKVGGDELGVFFNDDLVKNNILPCLFKSQTETGRAIALVSRDSERTFATYLGAAVELNEDDISEKLFKGYQYFHIEGYLVQNHALIEKAVKLAKKQGLKVSLDLASYNVVEGNLDFLKRIVRDYVDILFANEEESKAFTGLDPENALKTMGLNCEIVVVKIGKKGSLIKKGNEIENIGIIDVKALDTTGAGDLYAAGFIYGLIKNLPLKTCGQIGAILSGKVIEVIGAKIDEARWKEIHSLLAELSK